MNSQIAIASSATHLGTSPRSHTRARTRVDPLSLTVLLCAAVTALTGAAVLLGWFTGSEFLMTVLPGHIRMKPNTALGFIVAGLGLASALAPSSAARRTSRSLAAVTLAIGGLTLIEFIARVNLHFDELLFPDPTGNLFPGRMAHISAANFCLAGLTLLLLTRGPHARRFAEVTALLLTTVAFAAIVGYLYGVPVLYGSTGYTSMALHTDIAFLFLGCGLLLAPANSVLAQLLFAPDRGSWLARRVLPVGLVLPTLLGWLYLRPSLSFGSAIFAMALFAVTLTAAGAATLWLQAVLLNREQRQIAENDLLREQTAAAVRQSERELRLITDHLPTLLSYIDPSGRFVRVNRTYERWMGLPANAIVGKTIRELLGDAYWTGTLAARTRVLEGETVTFDIDYPTIHGDRHAQVTYAPDLDQAGRLRGMACLVLDIHGRRQAEAALRQSEKLAAVGRMASSIAHEINNPLEAVTNLLYLAEQETAGNDCAHQYVAQAQTELARVTHIVTQTLRFHRQATSPVLCRVADLITQVLVLYQGRLSQGHITLELRLRDTAPILCRDGEIRQALANFIGNAADAMKAGGRLRLRTSDVTDPHTGQPGVCVTIADTGHGISDTTRQRLFEPFHTTKGATGSGLGLWISKEIIDRHRGRLNIRSSVAPGRSGTIFRVSLYNLPPESKA